MIVATDDSYRDAKNITSRYNRHKAFEREIEANKERLQQVIEVSWWSLLPVPCFLIMWSFIRTARKCLRSGRISRNA